MNVLVAFGLILAAATFAQAQEASSPEDCLGCHAQALDELPADVRASMVEPTQGPPAEVRLLRERRLKVDEATYRDSVHGSTPCTSCHTDASRLPHRQRLRRVSCGACHSDIEALYRQSAHARALAGGTMEAATCQDCHGTHDIKPVKDRSSRVYPANVPRTCARCHSAADFPLRRAVRYVRPFEAYSQSIHFKALIERGLTVSATCESCHRSHTIKPSTDPDSSIFRINIPETCSQCHLGIYQQYKESIHGQAALAGILDSPVCTDCHLEHAIEAPEEPTSAVYAGTISKVTCPRCHSAERINRKYGLPSGQVKTYQDSFHGLADRFGETTVANCASCHGVHDIRPASDPKSAVHPDNLPATCGKCHPGAGPNFARGSVHIAPASKRDLLLYYVRLFYISLIVVTITGMAVHNGLDYTRKIIEHYKATRVKVRYERFTLNERIQHALLLVSFFTLVVTGFALRFPDAFWVKPFHAFRLGFLVRGYAHRVAAVIFILLCLYHLLYMLGTSRGRKQLVALLPRRKDIQDLIHQIRYYLGREPQRAKFGRFSYVEKSEYLALVWGSFIMILTGLILWFEVGALEWLPKWGWDLAEIVHYYEAWLATLAIFVWHLYHVMFNPEAHGVSLAMLTGELTEEDMEHEHGLELEEIKRKQSQEGGSDGRQAER